MLSGVTCSAAEMVGTAVFRMVVSSDSIKNATATSHGRRRLLEAAGWGVSEGTPGELMEAIYVCAPLYATKASEPCLAPVLDALPCSWLALFRHCLLAGFQSLCIAHDIARKSPERCVR